MGPERGGWTVRAALILLAGAIVGAGGSAKAPARSRAVLRTASDSAAIVMIEHVWLQTSDTAVLSRILAPDFVHVVPGGQFLTRAEHLAWVATHPHRPGVERRFAGLAVRLYGDVAIANGVVIVGDTAGRELGRSAFTDVFVWRGERWRAVNAQEDVVRRPGTNERDGAAKPRRSTTPAVRT
jgi:hypothetical protein